MLPIRQELGGLMALQIANPSVVRKVARLAQLDRIPDRPDATDPLPWDERGLPLLFKGEDFAETDIARAVEP
jgi:hypothetical protein